MGIHKYYRTPGLSKGASQTIINKIQTVVDNLDTVATELCYYVAADEELTSNDKEKLKWILSTPFQESGLTTETRLVETCSRSQVLIEIGPRLNFSTPISTNAVSICKSAGLPMIYRIEASVRYLLSFHGNRPQPVLEYKVVQCMHDEMTQMRYINPVETFDLESNCDPVYFVDVIGKGKSALEKANTDLGLAFDEWDLNFYENLFKENLKRNPTNIECFDLAQSNSEHCRHWFFRGKLILDGKEEENSLFQMVMATQNHTNDNNVIMFNDNSSGIKGYEVKVYKPTDPTVPSPMAETSKSMQHIIFTAETHNFPTGVAPFPGATTGTGGRIRDVHCTGRGAQVVAGTVGYCFGNLCIPGYQLPWEDTGFDYPNNFASPLKIAIEASNGASDYGNKFGEPVLTGFARSFGMEIVEGERREYIKPILFSGGIGQLDDAHIFKKAAKKGMAVAKIGGPIYRIGVGGGAASSIQIQGDNKTELDFNAVQRGDAEMEQKLNRLVRACVEMGHNNPIASIHDQGAGGNGNVLKEIVDPEGAVIWASQFQLGDPTISILELWGAEYQESNAILLAQEHVSVLKKIGARERCPVCIVGVVTGDGKIRLEDFSSKTIACEKEKDDYIVLKKDMLNGSGDTIKYPVDLDLEYVLGKMPQKVFHLNSVNKTIQRLSLPAALKVRDALERVLRLPSVASKRYLTNKVDRCVTGLVAQQQCVGPFHTPLADVAVTALSYMDKLGAATSIGEQPIKGLIDPACGARMSVAEALTNLVFAKVSHLKDVKCSGNWMWPAKLPGEGATLVQACKSMCDVMKSLGIAIDGGKDSLSMAARVGDKTVKAPGTLVISAYVGCPDITATVTPDLKCPNGKGFLLQVDISNGQHRLGGTALAQCYKQLGNEAPDLDCPDNLKSAFNITQKLITERKIASGHDISDGGFITCLLEMAFAGNCGIQVDIASTKDCTELERLFTEELGLILEVDEADVSYVMDQYRTADVLCTLIGHTCAMGTDAKIQIQVNGLSLIEEKMVILRDIWEETSFQLEYLQAHPKCIEQEQKGLKSRQAPPYQLNFNPDKELISHKDFIGKHCPKVAVLREEGSNSDREMAAALIMAGFEVWDVNMQDLFEGKISLDQFHGLVFAGGFSYADALGSAKGWAATALFNATINEQFRSFRERKDTFSFGVCNGCQLMALLGWVAPSADGDTDVSQGVLLVDNDSERFECRYVTVKIGSSPAIMLKDMEGTIFGMWSAHGEGKMVFKTSDIYRRLKANNLIPVHYVDDLGEPTMIYPFNPNGSPDGVAALCSLDGRHLAIMPHPERCFLPWQCPWMPREMKFHDVSPWFKMFRNAFSWSIQSINSLSG